MTTVDRLTEVDVVDAASRPPTDEEQFTRFCAAHRSKLLSFVRRRCWSANLPKSRVDPEDIVQEVLLTAWANWSTIDNPAKWTYVVARNRVGDRAEEIRRLADEDPAEFTDRQVLLLDDDGAIRDEPFEALLVNEVYTAFLKLPRQQRNATVLRHIVGLSSAEIAERLGCTPATADVHVHRGVRAVRKQLAEQALEHTMTASVRHSSRTRRLKRIVTGAAAAVVCALLWVMSNFYSTKSAPNPTRSIPEPRGDAPWIHLGNPIDGGVYSWLLISLGAGLVIFGIVAIVLLLRRRDIEDDEQ